MTLYIYICIYINQIYNNFLSVYWTNRLLSLSLPLAFVSGSSNLIHRLLKFRCIPTHIYTHIYMYTYTVYTHVFLYSCVHININHMPLYKQHIYVHIHVLNSFNTLIFLVRVCYCLLSVAVINTITNSNFGEERVYFNLHFQVTAHDWGKSDNHWGMLLTVSLSGLLPVLCSTSFLT